MMLRSAELGKTDAQGAGSAIDVAGRLGRGEKHGL
jgi:hypothetical protein